MKKMWNRIKFRLLELLAVDVCGKNSCTTCPACYRYTNGATGCHGATFLFGVAAKTYGVSLKEPVDESEEEE